MMYILFHNQMQAWRKQSAEGDPCRGTTGSMRGTTGKIHEGTQQPPVNSLKGDGRESNRLSSGPRGMKDGEDWQRKMQPA